MSEINIGKSRQPSGLFFRSKKGSSRIFYGIFFTQDSFRNYLSANVSGIGGSLMRVRPTIVEKFPILLPPTREQERITAKLDVLLSRLTAGEVAARRALNRLQRYRAAVLYAAVTGELTRAWRQRRMPRETGTQLLLQLLKQRREHWEKLEIEQIRSSGKSPDGDAWKLNYEEPAGPDTSGLPKLPSGWGWGSLKQCGLIIGGLTKNPRRDELHMKLPYLRVANVYANELRLEDVSTIGVEKHELGKLLLEEGDLLIVEGNGSKGEIGRVAIWDGTIDPCVHQNHIIKVRLVEKELGKWILAWLLSPVGRQYIEKVASSTTGLYTLSIRKVGNLPIALPPLIEQSEITPEIERRLAAADKLAAKLEQQLDQARSTHQSLLREAFTGHLVQQNLDDEPASALLDRIRALRGSPARVNAIR